MQELCHGQYLTVWVVSRLPGIPNDALACSIVLDADGSSFGVQLSFPRRGATGECTCLANQVAAKQLDAMPEGSLNMDTSNP